GGVAVAVGARGQDGAAGDIQREAGQSQIEARTGAGNRASVELDRADRLIPDGRGSHGQIDQGVGRGGLVERRGRGSIVSGGGQGHEAGVRAGNVGPREIAVVRVVDSRYGAGHLRVWQNVTGARAGDEAV